MKLFLLIILSILPTIVILSIVYKKDSEKEPIKLLLSLFGLGIVSCFITVLFSYISSSIFPALNSSKVNSSSNIFILILYSFFQVGFIEEFSKWIFNYSIGFNNNEFDQIYDSIVYAVFVSLGFATFENLLYVINGGFTTAIVRCLISVPSHAFFSVAMGYYIGLSKIAINNGNKKLFFKYMILSIAVPMLLHGFFDFCLLSGNLIFIVIFIVLVLFLYSYGISKIKQFSKVTSKLKNTYKYSYCTNCGTPVEDKYCTNCGYKIND